MIFKKPKVVQREKNIISSPINAQAVAPGFPQATRSVGQERVDAVESVGSVQQPPAAGWMRVVVVAVLVPVLSFHSRGGVAARLLHAATV